MLIRQPRIENADEGGDWGMEKNVIFAETGDASKVLKVSSTAVLGYAKNGLLPVKARTLRGGRLFDPADIERVRQMRAARRKVSSQVQVEAIG